MTHFACYCIISPTPKGTNRALSMSPSTFKISLWLIPPEEGGVRSHLQSSIDAIAAMTGGPSFMPHVTIMGGIPCLCSSEEEATRWAGELLQELSQVLPAIGGIPCQFGKEKGFRPHCVFEDGRILNGNNNDDDAALFDLSCVKWNQSAVAIMNRNSAFAKALS